MKKLEDILRDYRNKSNVCRGSTTYNIVEQQACTDIFKLMRRKLPKAKTADEMNFGRNISIQAGIENGRVYGHNAYRIEAFKRLR